MDGTGPQHEGAVRPTTRSGSGRAKSMTVHAERKRVKRTIAQVQTNVSLGGVNRGDEGDHCDHIRGAVDTNNNMQQHTSTIRGGRLKTS